MLVIPTKHACGSDCAMGYKDILVQVVIGYNKLDTDETPPQSVDKYDARHERLFESSIRIPLKMSYAISILRNFAISI